MTLGTAEFIRRFLIHVLGLHRIRHYGLRQRAPVPTTSHTPVSCSPLQNLRAGPPMQPVVSINERASMGLFDHLVARASSIDGTSSILVGSR
jgi:hypothetical protein